MGTAVAYISIVVGGLDLELACEFDFTKGIPDSWDEPGNGPEVYVRRVVRIEPDPKNAGLFKMTADEMPPWFHTIVEDEFYNGDLSDAFDDAMLDSDGF